MEDIVLIILDEIKHEKNWLVDYLKEKRQTCHRTFVFFPHEWSKRKEQINSHLKSYRSSATTYFARKCTVKQIDKKIMRMFCDAYHIQGSNTLAVVCFGIFHKDELLGVLSLGRHHRNKDETILDRMCFKSDIRVVGGASKMFASAVAWAGENLVERITSYSDNRYSLGTVYEKLKFKLERELPPDYFYVHKDDINKVHSKQSQKKDNVNCPSHMTEKQWASERGLLQVFDAGKKRWAYELKSRSKIKLISRRKGYYKTVKSIPNVIYYQSSYELRAATLLDNDDNVDYYKTQVRFNVDGRERILDFMVTYIGGQRCIIEVKPTRRLHEFREQIEDNRVMAKKNNCDFLIWTEFELGFKSEYFATKWADEYIGSLQSIDFVQERKENNLSKAKKYYHKNIANDKVTVFCSFCQMDHAPLRLTHDKNIARNGRYICEREGGHMAGSRPKPHLQKDNPHLADGKKECLKCKFILDLAEFGVDKGRRDGFSSRCKKCRAASATSKYQSKTRKENEDNNI